MIILLHSSKTMRSDTGKSPYQKPVLLDEAGKIASYLAELPTEQFADSMKISGAMATKTKELFTNWDSKPEHQSVAIDSFIGDIYSGLQAPSLTKSDRQYASKSLYILSGLYGVIKPLDSIMPYRLEMMYKFPDSPYDNMYKFWGTNIANQIPESGIIANLSSVEYSKTVLPYVDQDRVITPQFFTMNPKTGKPTFVTVHSKIARGAFARWLITTRTDTVNGMNDFDLLNYEYSAELSLPGQPAFVAKQFGGIGLSIRLAK